MSQPSKYDEIGYWSEIKLDIIKEYASAYSRIISSQTAPQFYHLYIDAFAGPGKHISKNTGRFVPGSPENALLVRPSFREYHFIDLDKQKIESLENMAGTRGDIYIYHGDCNYIMLDSVFPRAMYEDYRRALCVLDPYGLHLNWEVIADAFRTRLKKVAGFQNVPKPIAMRNTQNAVVYYLFFASHKPVAENIVQAIFNKYKNRRGS
jgi:hypothetical protein